MFKLNIRFRNCLYTFNSFAYWRQALPDIEDDLADLLNEQMDVSSPKRPTKLKTSSSSTEQQEYSSVNYWKTPVFDVDVNTLLEGLK